jgi:hypothetical protein
VTAIPSLKTRNVIEGVRQKCSLANVEARLVTTEKYFWGARSTPLDRNSSPQHGKYGNTGFNAITLAGNRTVGHGMCHWEIGSEE